MADGTGNQYERGSDEDPVHQCQQCADDGLIVQAAGYCTHCTDFLCSSCIQLHRKLKIFKDHVIQEDTYMPSEKPSGSTIEKCLQHQMKPLELYCPYHDTMLCVLCFAYEHNSCSNIEPIDDLTKDFETSNEMKEIHHEFKQHKQLMDLFRVVIEQFNKDNENYYKKTIDDYQTFRLKMTVMLDQLGENVLTEASQLKDRNKGKLDTLKEQIMVLEKESKTLISEIEQTQKTKETKHLFIAAKRNKIKMKEVVKKLDQLKTEIQIKKYTFEANQAVKECTEDKTTLGEVKVLSYDKLSATGEIENDNSSITGIVEISPSELVVTDYDNKCVKKIDVNKNEIIQRLALKSSPIDLTVLPDSRVAVALPDQRKVQMISTDNGLILDTAIPIDGRCLGIAAMGDTLVVAFKDPGQVKFLDNSGIVIKSFIRDPSGSPLFDYPRFLSMSPDHTSIYISDGKQNTVTCMSIDGTVLWTYSDNELKYPQGIATRQDGSLYVCSSDSHTIHVLSAAGAKEAIIPIEKFKLHFPKIICCSKSHGIIYVSAPRCKKIKRLS